MHICCPDCGQFFDSDAVEGLTRCVRCGSQFNVEPHMMTEELHTPSEEEMAQLTQRLDRLEVAAEVEARERPPHELIGQEIGGYRIDDVLGRGGMGVVFKATHATLGTLAAIKILPSDFAESNETAVKRFVREAQASAKLKHENIVAVYDAGIYKGTNYIVMEFVEGSNLQEILSEKGKLPLKEAMRILHQTCMALRCAHDNGIIHRDIKPANIMVTAEGVVKLADLGLAKSVDEVSALTLSGCVVGTPHYMAPEQIGARKNMDNRVDIYALGCVAYRTLCGKVPFDGPTSYSILEKHVYEAIPEPTMAEPSIPEAVAEVIKRMLSKGASGRYGTAGQVAEAFQRAMQGEPEPPDPLVLGVARTRKSSSTTRRPSTKSYSPPQPQARVGLLIIGFLLIVAIVSAVVFSQRGPDLVVADWRAASARALDRKASLEERIKALDDFLATHPDSDRSDEARSLLELLKGQRGDAPPRGPDASAPAPTPQPAPPRAPHPDDKVRIEDAINEANASYDSQNVDGASTILERVKDLSPTKTQAAAIADLKSRIENRARMIANHRAWYEKHLKSKRSGQWTWNQTVRHLGDEYDRTLKLIQRYPKDPYVKSLNMPIILTSNVPGAKVYRQGRMVGTTPLAFMYVPGDETDLLIQKDGYKKRSLVLRLHHSSEMKVQLLRATAWEADVKAPVSGTPAVVGNELVVACTNGRIVALNRKTGATAWRYRPSGKASFVGPVTAHGGSIYLGSSDGQVFAIRAGGGSAMPSWDLKLPGAVKGGIAVAKVALRGDRACVFVGCEDGRVYCFDAETGRQYWASEQVAPIRTTPLVTYRAVYVADGKGKIHAFSVGNGKAMGTAGGGPEVRGSPVMAGGRICVGAGAGLTCSVADGAAPLGAVHRHPSDGEVFSAPAAKKSTVYFGTTRGKCYAVDVTARAPAWPAFKAKAGIYSAPAVGSKHVYFGDADSGVYAIDLKSGKLTWKFRGSFEIRAGIVYDRGQVYVACQNGHIAAFKNE